MAILMKKKRAHCYVGAKQVYCCVQATTANRLKWDLQFSFEAIVSYCEPNSFGAFLESSAPTYALRCERSSGRSEFLGHIVPLDTCLWHEADLVTKTLLGQGGNNCTTLESLAPLSHILRRMMHVDIVGIPHLPTAGLHWYYAKSDPIDILGWSRLDPVGSLHPQNSFKTLQCNKRLVPYHECFWALWYVLVPLKTAALDSGVESKDSPVQYSSEIHSSREFATSNAWKAEHD